MSREPYITNCLLVPRQEQDGAMFNSDGEAFLDGYAIIPIGLFKAMGGTEHPAYQEMVVVPGRIAIGSVSIERKEGSPNK